jgi:hypothetical protein
MIRSRARLVRLGAFAMLALVLSACIKLDMSLTVNSDDTVDGKVIFALNKELIELSGQSPEDLLGASGPIPTDAEGVSTAPYEDDEFQGQEITLDGVPLAQFNEESSGEDSLRIVRQGETYVVSGALDLSDTGGATGATGFPGAEEMFASAQMKLVISFPGEVTESNGQIDGNTVTWIPEVGERLELHAVAGATGGGDSNTTLMILLVVGAIVIILAIVLGVLATRRKNAQQATADGTTAGDGTAGVAPSTAPPAGGTAPPPPPPPPSEPQP